MKYFTLDSLDVREVFWDAHPKRVLQGATGVPSDSDLSLLFKPVTLVPARLLRVYDWWDICG